MAFNPESRFAWLPRTTVVVLGALVLHLAFMWPSPRHFGEGIPCTSYNTEATGARMLVPGDHLQLLYHFQLVRGMLSGRIPPFVNLYEFNLGDDDARRAFDPHYLPFSLFFAAASPVFGDAAGWNLSLALAVLVGFALLLMLARRFQGDEPNAVLAFTAAFIATCVPYRWVTLAGGSPTGFGIALIPAVALGVDIAVRDGRVRGGVLAGVMLVLCYATDLHSFLFATLALPFWCLVSWASATETPLPGRQRFTEIVKALLPLVMAVVAAGAIALWLRAQYAVTDAGAGRSLRDIKVHSPVWQAIFDPFHPSHMAQHIHLGDVLPVLLTACGLLALLLATKLLRRPRERSPRLVGDVVCLLLLAAAIVGAVLLALGVHGPLDALPLRVLRKLVPPFRMVRQPVKVFCLLPTLLAPFLVIAFTQARQYISRRGFLESCVVLAAVLVLVSARQGMSVGTCLLPKTPNRAYQAAADAADAADATGSTARALVLPIWPGDSAWSSLYEYHAMRAGLRMLNGYSPVKTDGYLDAVFRRFESVTQGVLDDDQLAALREFGVTAVILHEDAFPEKVSPFPVGVTLRRLLAHPHLRLLEQDRATWSFEILDTPSTDAASSPVSTDPDFHAPARWWHFAEKGHTEGLVPATLPGGELTANVWTPADTPESYAWLVRLKDGILTMQTGPRQTTTNAVADVQDVAAGKNWTWAAIPAGPCGADHRTWLAASGDARIADVLFAKSATSLPKTNADGIIRFAAVDFFHAGHTARDDGGALTGVRFEPLYDPVAEIAYGPNLPLDEAPGRFVAQAEGSWEAADTSTWRVMLGGREVAVAGIDDTAAFDYDGSSVLTIRYRYAGRHPVFLRGFTLRRMAEPGR
ncbi:MAG: hypothetical protein ACOX9C_07215 [Kiritimatiellia bacterium]